MNALAFSVATFNFPFGALFHDAKDLTSPLVHRRIPLEVIPEDEAECAAWLHKLYQEKVSVLKMCDRTVHLKPCSHLSPVCYSVNRTAFRSTTPRRGGFLARASPHHADPGP